MWNKNWKQFHVNCLHLNWGKGNMKHGLAKKLTKSKGELLGEKLRNIYNVKWLKTEARIIKKMNEKNFLYMGSGIHFFGSTFVLQSHHVKLLTFVSLFSNWKSW